MPRRLSKIAPLLLAAALAPPIAKSHAAETCRFTGATDYNGHLTATVTTKTAGPDTHMEFRIIFDATTMPWWHIHYLIEEISDWRDHVLQRLAVNDRYSVGAHIIRQQWDVFDRTPRGLEAQRVQAKTLAQLQHRHPGFVAHWDPSAFGTPWLNDYKTAPPERRPDLDLPAAPPNIQAPFALAFTLIRSLPASGAQLPVFLPGFKTGKTIDLSITHPAPQTWHADLNYPWLSKSPVSHADAQLSPDGHLQRLTFALHGAAGSAHGDVRAAGCE